MSTEPDSTKLPPYSLDVQALDLGPSTRAVGLELIETESREPLTGEIAAEIWSAVFPALANKEPYVLDFFSHLDRVRDFCNLQKIPLRESQSRCLVILQPEAAHLRELIGRFAGETFGFRAGEQTLKEDPALEAELSHRGLDAYQAAYPRYSFCAVCEPNDGWVTLLSETLWASEVIRRVRPAAAPFDLYLARPH